MASTYFQIHYYKVFLVLGHFIRFFSRISYTYLFIYLFKGSTDYRWASVFFIKRGKAQPGRSIYCLSLNWTINSFFCWFYQILFFILLLMFSWPQAILHFYRSRTDFFPVEKVVAAICFVRITKKATNKKYISNRHFRDARMINLRET